MKFFRISALLGLLGPVLLAGLVTPRVHGYTFVPPLSLGDLASHTDAVVLAEALESKVFRRGAFIFTHTTFQVVFSLNGPLAPGQTFVVEVPGGEVNGRIWAVTGSPAFEPENTYLLCLTLEDAKPTSVWQLPVLDYGVLREIEVDGRSTLLPMHRGMAGARPRLDGRTPEQIGSYATDALVPHLRGVLRGTTEWRRRDAGVLSSAAESEVRLKGTGSQVEVPDGCNYFDRFGRFFRWNIFDTGGSATMFADSTGDLDLSTPSDALTRVSEALDSLNNAPGTTLDLRYGGELDVSQTCTPGVEDPLNDLVIFNDPCNDLPDLNEMGLGILALGGPVGEGTHTFRDLDGRDTRWVTIVSWAALVNNGAGDVLTTSGYRIMLAHEFGHGLGFRHFDDPNALMFAECCNNLNNLDRTCLAFTYPGDSEPVTNLACQCNVSGNIDLSWTNAPGPIGSRIVVRINGFQIAEINGNRTSYEIDSQDFPSLLNSITVANDTGIQVQCDFSSETDCQLNGIPDACDLNSGAARDCNGNTTLDVCDIGTGASEDCDQNGIPDECDLETGAAQDCNSNTRPDSCDIADSVSNDVDNNDIPDECVGQQLPGDCNQDGSVDIVDPLCLLWILFGGGGEDLPCEMTLDSPGNTALLDWQPDGLLNIADAVSVLLFVFTAGDSHALAPTGSTADCTPIVGCPDLAECD